MILFLGSKQLGLSALKTLLQVAPQYICAVATFDDSFDARSVLSDFRAFTEAKALPLAIAKRPSELRNVIQLYTPSIVMVVGWYWIIPPDLLTKVPSGFVGVHASLLPKYRGNAPLVWALINGENRTGATMFYFDDGIDTGDIIAQVAFDITSHETIADLLVKAEAATINLIEQHAVNLVEGTAPRLRQNHTDASYGSLRRPEDGRIDWKQNAYRIYNFIRAQSRPYPGAYTYTPDGNVLRIWRASIFPYSFYGIPGLICQKYGDGTIIACGEGALVLQEYEAESEDFLLKWGMKLS
ncbi:MAG: methionyl-tRNA formyltransferase [Caldilinea sp. CFX5]|nr:methionyl-tRNA formyltransferase [Caldilinea sp. CFX5]